MEYLDIQISLDGADAATNDAIRGEGSYDTAMTAMRHLKDAGFGEFKISVVITRHNIAQLDEFKAIADEFGAQPDYPASAFRSRCRYPGRASPNP